tara:strand:+ start:86 stop:505 length:420 start_codon:yes stop_codon:yes gene_type:complete
MAFDGLNLNPYSSVQSKAATKGMSNLPMLENKAKARLLVNEYQNQQAIEAAKLGYQAQLDAFKPQEKSWGSVIGDVFGSASKAGLFDGFGGGGNQFSGRGSSGTDLLGRDFDDPRAGFYGKWIEDTPSNPWYNPFGWGS